MSAKDVSASEWQEEVLNSKILTAVDFWAPWCPWCMKLRPVFEELASRYSGRIRFAKVNVDTQHEIATKYGIMGIPVIKFFCDGIEVGEVVGYLPKEKLRNEIDKMSQTHRQCVPHAI